MKKTTSFFAINALITIALLVLFGLLFTPVHGHTREPDRSECGSMVSVLNDGPSQGGEPRVDQSAFNKSCVQNARERRTWTVALTVLAVGLGAFEIVYRRMDPARRARHNAVVGPFRD